MAKVGVGGRKLTFNAVTAAASSDASPVFARAEKISLQDYEFQSLEVPKFLNFCGIDKQLEEIFLYGTYSFYMNAEKVCSASVAFLVLSPRLQ